MGFLIVANTSSRFGLSYQDTDDVNAAVTAWYQEPDLNYVSSFELLKSVNDSKKLQSITEPSFIKDTKNIWYQVDDIEQYELNIIGLSNQDKRSKLVTQIFFYGGGTYIRQLQDPQPLLQQFSEDELSKYLSQKKIPTTEIIGCISSNSHSGTIKYDEFTIQYVYALNPITRRQMVNGLTGLQITERMDVG